jgi:Xaa-Pro aminopeptidase
MRQGKITKGEPDAETLKCASLIQIGWQAACNMMKPRTKGSDIVKKGLDVMRRERLSSFNHSLAHAISLEHADHPAPIGPDGLGAAPGFIVGKDMVLNLDQPFQECVWGSMHIEDILRVTDDGFEPLTSLNT